MRAGAVSGRKRDQASDQKRVADLGFSMVVGTGVDPVSIRHVDLNSAQLRCLAHPLRSRLSAALRLEGPRPLREAQALLATLVVHHGLASAGMDGVCVVPHVRWIGAEHRAL